MFQQHLLAEVLSDQSDKAKAAMSSGEDEISRDMFGADVVIEGLSKFPAFNGVCGRVQSFDEQSGRYTIMFPSLVCGHQFAKVIAEVHFQQLVFLLKHNLEHIVKPSTAAL